MATNNRLMDNLRVDINIPEELQRLISHGAEIAPQATKLGLRAITKQGSKEVKSNIQSAGLYSTGTYAKSVKGVTTKNKSFIGTKLFYAKFLEDGAKPHKIKPRKRGRNRGLYINGRWVKSVTHPGIRGKHVFADTFEHMQSSGEINSLFSAGVQAALEAIENGN